ncbi:MAG: prepilin-type N-terminal cleavage/methylation domain-containing protein, partial [Candidatus Jacksonbacteria bacterium]|nr:prepilin-type N-terminal cleavage/methylation domain-containing protein [Candidatus Jacksonbacteria bacterium]
MKSIKSTAGFTLLELMVTTSLIIIISAAMFVNLRDYNSSKQLDLAGNEFVFQAERMRNFAQTGKKFNNSVPSGGWGVHFSSGT